MESMWMTFLRIGLMVVGSLITMFAVLLMVVGLTRLPELVRDDLTDSVVVVRYLLIMLGTWQLMRIGTTLVVKNHARLYK